MKTISHEKTAQIHGGTGSPGYIDATEYSMIKFLWAGHAACVAEGDIAQARKIRDAIYALHASSTQY